MPGKRASPVRREAVRKGPSWYLAGGPPYRPAGSEEGCAEKARLRLKRTRDLAAQPILYTKIPPPPRSTCTPT